MMDLEKFRAVRSRASAEARAVMEAEDRILEECGHFRDDGEASVWIGAIVGSQWFMDRFGMVRPLVRRNKRGERAIYSFAIRDTDTIVLATTHRLVALHELAHLLTDRVGHHDQFRRIVVSLVGRMYGTEMAAVLRSEYEKRGLEV